ncbi:MAG: Eco57I restriction-modification methylase domain-containing protein [Bradymonadaceae bacterium]
MNLEVNLKEWLLPVADLELGERVFSQAVTRWQTGHETLDYAILLDALSAGMAALRGIEDSPRNEGELGVLLREGVGDDELGRDLLMEPHALGWFHQHWGTRGRKNSFAGHHHREEKHVGQTVSTRLYTPRWVADFLARWALWGLESNEIPSICDPAVGGGQMLFAGLEALRRRYPDQSLSVLVGRLHGTDLDPRAVEVTRRGLKLEVGRVLGRRCLESEALIDRQIRVDDGLFGDEGAYDVVLTNPPYMGVRSMPWELKERLREVWSPYHGDLYAAFIARCHQLATRRVGILAQQTLWYLSSFAKARADLLGMGHLQVFMHLGPHAFESLSGEKANVVAFVQCAEGTGEKGPTTFFDFRELKSSGEKRDAYEAALRQGETSSEQVRSMDVEVFSIIPRQPIAHWLPSALRRWFGEDRCLGDMAEIPGGQNKTGNNGQFLRPFDEVEPEDIRFSGALWPGGREEGSWVFYSKGGRFSPWWGNWRWVVDWSEEARRFYAENRTSNLLDEVYWFREGICYTDFGGARFNARWMPPGCLFDMAGPAIFPHPNRENDDVRLFALLAILNSTAARALLNALNPTLHYQVRDLRLLPMPMWNREQEEMLAALARGLVEDLRFLSRFNADTPLFSSRIGPEERVLARKVITGLPAREAHLDHMVCELYDVPEMALSAGEGARHPLLAGAESALAQVREIHIE